MKRAEKVKKVKNLNGYLIAGVIALIVAIVGYVFLVASENAVLGKYDRTNVYIAKETIAKGTPLKDDMFKKKSIDTEIVPANAIRDISQIKDTYVSSELPKNQVLTESNLVNIHDVVQGEKEVGLNIKDLAGSVNGVLRPSDYVDIYIIPKTYSSHSEDSTTYIVGDEAMSEEEYNARTAGLSQLEMDREAARNNDPSLMEGNPEGGEEQVNVPSDTPTVTENKTGESMIIATTGADGTDVSYTALKPTYRHIYVSKVFNNDGDSLTNADQESLAMRFNILMSADDANYLISAMQTSYIYVVIDRTDGLINPETEKATKEQAATDAMTEATDTVKNKVKDVTENVTGTSENEEDADVSKETEDKKKE